MQKKTKQKKKTKKNEIKKLYKFFPLVQDSDVTACVYIPNF